MKRASVADVRGSAGAVHAERYAHSRPSATRHTSGEMTSGWRSTTSTAATGSRIIASSHARRLRRNSPRTTTSRASPITTEAIAASARLPALRPSPPSESSWTSGSSGMKVRIAASSTNHEIRFWACGCGSGSRRISVTGVVSVAAGSAGAASAAASGSAPTRARARRRWVSSSPVSRSVGKRMTSRIWLTPASSITSRSTPIPSPPVGGSPYSSART